MRVFSSDSRGVVAWGPAASVDVRVSALGGIVDRSWILVNFSIGAREIVDIRQCFNDTSFIYALGNNQSSCQISLTFAIFFGAANCMSTNNTNDIRAGIDAYAEGRISKQIGRAHV